MKIDHVKLNDATAYCKCHDPACTGQGHCVDNMKNVRRPGRADMIEWLAFQQKA